MARTPKTLRIPEPLERDLAREFAARGIKEWSAGVVELLHEAVRMRRVPGIVFVDSITGRRPVVAGTGVDVWEVIATRKALADNEEQLCQAYHWLSPAQVRAAVAYYELYPDEIDERLALEESWTPERVRDALPFAVLGPGLGDEDSE